MCDLLLNLKISDVTDILTMLIALTSAWLLYRTFKSQETSIATAKEVSEINKKAMRGQYLPVINEDLEVIYPKHINNSGDSSNAPYNNGNTTIIVKIIFRKNAVQLIDHKCTNGDKHISITTSHNPFETDKILLPDNYFMIKYTINFKDHFNLETPSLNQNGPHKSLFLHNELYFLDMVGNKYELTFNIEGVEKLTVSDLRMID